ncbi:MAG: catechol 1,2-dioxygenase, partial [Dermatophilaceae bacterium]|nr:catechol 1,2-dioxygenase [Dermatophilaceae bacterium]
MTTDLHLNGEVATAAASGNAATERFATDKS